MGGVNIATPTNPTFYYYLASDYNSNVPNLQLISLASGLPTSGKNLVIAGTDNSGLLHIRIFDANGVLTDTFETKDSSDLALDLVTADASGTVLSDKPESSLPIQANAITTLKQQLPGLLPPHVLTVAETAQVLGEVTSIVGQTNLSNPNAAQPLAGPPSDAGNYVAVADFVATGNYAAGGAVTSFSITPAATATAITSSANPAVYGQPITYTATVTNTSGTTPAPVPVGSVQFVVDGVNSGSAGTLECQRAGGPARHVPVGGQPHRPGVLSTKHQLRWQHQLRYQQQQFVDPGRAVDRPRARPVKPHPHRPVHWQLGGHHQRPGPGHPGRQQQHGQHRCQRPDQAQRRQHPDPV